MFDQPRAVCQALCSASGLGVLRADDSQPKVFPAFLAMQVPRRSPTVGSNCAGTKNRPLNGRAFESTLTPHVLRNFRYWTVVRAQATVANTRGRKPLAVHSKAEAACTGRSAECSMSGLGSSRTNRYRSSTSSQTLTLRSGHFLGYVSLELLPSALALFISGRQDRELSFAGWFGRPDDLSRVQSGHESFVPILDESSRMRMSNGTEAKSILDADNRILFAQA